LNSIALEGHAQLQADRFLLFVERERLFQPAPILQDHCLVPEPILQCPVVLLFLGPTGVYEAETFV
jgi:hypothetical protein